MHSVQPAAAPHRTAAADRLKECARYQAEGNALVKSGQAPRAVRKYRAGLAFATATQGMDEADVAEARRLQVTLHLNIAVCGIKALDWHEVRLMWGWAEHSGGGRLCSVWVEPDLWLTWARLCLKGLMHRPNAPFRH